MHTRFSFPTDIRFGLGAIADLAPELQARAIKRPLIISDKFLAHHEVVQSISADLGQQGLSPHVFGGVFGNPDDTQVSAACDSYHEHQADCILAVGGGASIDVAKAVALLVSNGGHLADYASLDISEKFTPRAIKHRLPYLIAIPTTAGTGSEVGRSTVISDPKTKLKRVIFDPRLLPQLVIADANLTKSLPAAITAATGMDAVTHLIEAFSVREFHPLCDGIALEGLYLVGRSLKAACLAAQNHDTSTQALEHRSNMLAASMMGAIAFQKGLGVNHSIAHALSTVCDLHHGLANALVLPQVIKYNYEIIPEKYARISNALGANNQPLARFIADLIQTIGIAPGLSAHGVSEEHVNDLVDIAFRDSCHQTNPRLVNKEDLRAVISSSI